ncbi:MAG: hypothetical protein JXR50_03435 [Prolixibacteraceae bacterium]|nr:hypothetical protein [Prolixibacteraceae bacterium]MBN2648774.1 hypothetical protein [Prolixibacteraceae bacterium]
MKRVLIISILFFFFALNASAKSIIKETNTFTITTNEDIQQPAGEAINSWVIEYGGNDSRIEVFKNTTRKGEEYLVRNASFEVRYINTDKGFGVKWVNNKQSDVPFEITRVVINEHEMKNQSLLSAKPLSEKKALDYIASFVPYLLNENYKHLLN